MSTNIQTNDSKINKRHPKTKLNMEEMVCPLPWSHEDNSEEITYGEIEIANKSLSDVVDACLLNGNYTLGYAIVLNAIESMGITYFYRFCEFAREMNKRGATILEYLKEFDLISPLIVSKFNREWISSESRSNIDKMICPIPWNHANNSEEITYGEIEIANKSLSDVVDGCLLNGNYTLGYAIVLNAIESMGITYFYRFCEFAREMNKRGATILEYLKEFDLISPLIVSKFNREWISSESYECILVVYKKHGNKYKDYEFKNVDEEYRSDLLSCMDLMKDKLYFVETESHIELTNNFSKEELIQIYKNNVQYISKLIKLTYSVLKYIVHEKNGNSSIVCMQNGGMVNETNSFIPCGHGWCCDKCIILIDKCPICRQNFTDIQNFNILTPGSLLSKNYWLLKPICVFDQGGARCVSCLSKINDVNPPKKYVMIPCGHGWYCNKCSSQKNCIVCNNKVENEICVYL